MDEAMNFVITAGAVAPMPPVNYSSPKNLAGPVAERPGGIAPARMNGSRAHAPRIRRVGESGRRWREMAGKAPPAAAGSFHIAVS
jgi:hypothetical protein